MRAYRQECDNSFDYFIYFSLSSQHISLFVCNTALSLSLSPFGSSSLCCFLFLSHFHFFYLSLSSSLSTFRYYRRKSDPSQHLFLFFFFFSCHYLSLFLFLSRRRRRFRFEAKLADWSSPIWTSARWSKPLLTQRQSPIFACRTPQSLIFARRPLQLSPPIFYYFILLRFLDLEFVGGSGDWGCSLWRWL